MRPTRSHRPLVASIGLALAWLDGANASDSGVPRETFGEPAQIAALGKELFESPKLSEDGKVSCATCHEPAREFTDGRTEAIGVFGLPNARNSATLLGIAHVAAFPESRKFDGERTAVSLEERCLAPLDDELELGGSVKATVFRLQTDAALDRRFAEAFGEQQPNVTRQRLGAALAAHLRSLTAPESAYDRFRAGDAAALDDAGKAGLAAFEGRGRCSACHAGPAFTDGLVHRVRVRPSAYSERRKLEFDRSRIERAALLQDAIASANSRSERIEARDRRTEFGSTLLGGYDGIVPNHDLRHTLPLLAVSRTAPYFRDGSVDDLEAAVRVHLEELFDVSGSTASAEENVPDRLRPGPVAPDGGSYEPAELEEAEIAALVAFLRTL